MKPVRAFSVRLDSDSKDPAVRLGLIVDGVLIPATALIQHQTSRREQAVVMQQRSIRIVDVAADGDIVLVRGPAPDDPRYPPDATGSPDHVAAFPSRTVAAGDVDVVLR